MPPQTPPTQISPTQVPQGQVDPMMMALLRARAAGGAGGPAPNGLPIPGAPAVPQPSSASGPMPPPQGGASPSQQIMKKATAAQSPLMDDQTRQIAKSLIQKLMQHM
jgi:hypothetical protein